jgi:hypothetical protein
VVNIKTLPVIGHPYIDKRDVGIYVMMEAMMEVMMEVRNYRIGI